MLTPSENYKKLQLMSSNSSRNFNEFGDALKWLLDERGKSQGWLSKQTEIDPGTISKYVTGELNPPRKRRIKRFGRIIGGEIKKEADDTWTASFNEDVKEAMSSVDQVEERLSSYKGKTQSLDALSQDLQSAKRMIERSLEEIDRIRGED